MVFGPTREVGEQFNSHTQPVSAFQPSKQTFYLTLYGLCIVINLPNKNQCDAFSF
jgi:hypothetical protein